MLDALYIGATGMQSQQLNVDTIANNLVNANTPGFKKGRVSFVDLMVNEAARLSASPGVEDINSMTDGPRAGAGVGVASLSKTFEPGDMRKTDSAFDVAIQGDGFMELSMADGSRSYMRGGTLKVNRDGLLANSAGDPIKPGIAIPENTQTLTIARDGKVLAQTAGQATPTEIGQMDLVRFISPTGLTALGEGTYRSTAESGEPVPMRAGEDGAGLFAQGFLEGSNVRMVDEMVNLMLAQRAYEASVKVVQASDEMLGLVNGLRK